MRLEQAVLLGEIDKNFNPRTPYGMRLDYKLPSSGVEKFQSTHPLRDATFLLLFLPHIIYISIHAPLTGCDFV